VARYYNYLKGAYRHIRTFLNFNLVLQTQHQFAATTRSQSIDIDDRKSWKVLQMQLLKILQGILEPLDTSLWRFDELLFVDVHIHDPFIAL